MTSVISFPGVASKFRRGGREGGIKKKAQAASALPSGFTLRGFSLRSADHEGRLLPNHFSSDLFTARAAAGLPRKKTG